MLTADEIEKLRTDAHIAKAVTLDPQTVIALCDFALTALRPAPVAVTEEIFARLRDANIARQAAWCPDQVPDLSFRGNELAGETGEVCNVIKKLERERLGWRGSRDTFEHLAEELADVVICADLCALSAGIDLNAAVIAKFNATSEKVGLPHRLTAALSQPAPVGKVRVKPLEWEQPQGALQRHRALATGHCYFADKLAAGGWRLTLNLWARSGHFDLGDFDAFDEAKAAAQADYEARIRSALEPAPEPPAPAPVGGEPVAWVSQKALDLVREQGRSESDVTLWGQGYADEHVPLYASPAVDRAGIIETAAVAGWNAFRKSLYAVCEDVQRQADDTRIKATVGSASQEHHAKGYHAGINYAAKSIARGFNAMEAMDDDNLVAAISPTRDKRT